MMTAMSTTDARRIAFLSIIRFIFAETDKYVVLCNMSMDKERDAIRSMGRAQYHFCTDGFKEGKLFYGDDDYAFGMAMVALIGHQYGLTIYVFTLMPNHLHIILEGTGADCLSAFNLLRRKFTARLKRLGHPPLPEDYWFHLTKIETPEQMRQEIIYVLRNPLEKGLGIVGGYLWSSGWLYHSGIGKLVDTMPDYKPSGRKISILLGGEHDIPDTWRFHPLLGVHPGSFVDTSLVLQLFPEPKDLQTALVKDYEVFFQIARRMGELYEFSKAEREAIVSQTLQKRFNGHRLNSLSEEERGKLAIILNHEFGFDSYQISKTIFVKEKTIRQLLASKLLR